MNEVKTPKKPLVFYYGIAMVVLLLLNVLVMPLTTQHQVEEVELSHVHQDDGEQRNRPGGD